MIRAARPAAGDAPRRVAFDLVRAVTGRGAYANLTLGGLIASAGLAGRDAALATELGYGTVRRLPGLDAVLGACSARPLAELDPALLDCLRLGAYQLLHTRVPAHAAVSTTVELARAAVGSGAARYANAVLRRVAGRDWAAWLDELAPAGVARSALAHGLPEWIGYAFGDALGPAAADELDAALAASTTPARVHLVARPGRIGRDALLAQAGEGAAATPFSPYGVVLARGDPGALPAVRTGAAAVQDEGSQLVALALAGAGPGEPDGRWLDAAAGPGGKAALLAGLAGPAARLLAVDVSAHRARLAATAAAPPALVVRADSRRGPWRDGTFDRVLLDAPCSGLGALRRRPDAAWRRTPADVARLSGLQRELLAAALAALRPGGVLAYATCSPHLAETRAVVRAVTGARPGVEALDARRYLPGVPGLGEGPHVQLWPHRHGTDAMFLALLRAPG